MQVALFFAIILNMRDIGEAFSFPFKDPNWLAKMVVGTIFAAFCVLLIGFPVVCGYYIELIQRMRRHEQYPLPEWKDVGVKFIVGFKYIVVLVIYNLPTAVILIPALFLLVVANLHHGGLSEMVAGTGFAMIIILLVLPYSLFIAALKPIIAARFSERESIGDALDVGEVLRLFKSHWRDACLAMLLAIGVQILASVGIIFSLVGIFATSFYGYLVASHLYGQIARTIDDSRPSPAPSAI